MSGAPLPGNGDAPATTPRTRGGMTVTKVYDGDPSQFEHRANMFRKGLLPDVEPSRRAFAKQAGLLAGCVAVLGLVLAGDVASAGLLIPLGLAGVGWAAWELTRRTELTLSAVNPYAHDRLLENAGKRASQLAMERLGFVEEEDVRVRTAFLGAGFYTIKEVVATPSGFEPHPSERVFTLHFGLSEERARSVRFGYYEMHHIYANESGLAYVRAAWDFIDDGPDDPRVIDMNRWVWRTVENLRVQEDRFTIQTVGGKEFDLPYISDAKHLEQTRQREERPVSASFASPGASDRTAGAIGASSADGEGSSANGEGSSAAPTGIGTSRYAEFWSDPERRKAAEEHLRAARNRAVAFVNTVNSLRAEWEADH
jgi:hypothetical protein